MFGIWRIDVRTCALSVRFYLFIVSWSCGSQHVLLVELDVLCHDCFVKFFFLPCGPDMYLIDVVCCPLCFFYVSRIILRFIRPLIYLVCFKTEEDTSTGRITRQVKTVYEDCFDNAKLKIPSLKTRRPGRFKIPIIRLLL